MFVFACLRLLPFPLSSSMLTLNSSHVYVSVGVYRYHIIERACISVYVFMWLWFCASSILPAYLFGIFCLFEPLRQRSLIWKDPCGSFSSTEFFLNIIVWDGAIFVVFIIVNRCQKLFCDRQFHVTCEHLTENSN